MAVLKTDHLEGEPTARISPRYNKQWRLIGALNGLTGRLDYLDAYIIGREKLIVFYRQLLVAYPDAKRIYVVQDNWSIHSHEQVQAALAEMPQMATFGGAEQMIGY